MHSRVTGEGIPVKINQAVAGFPHSLHPPQAPDTLPSWRRSETSNGATSALRLATYSDLHSFWPSVPAGGSETHSVPPGFVAPSSLVPRHLQTQ